MPHIPNLYTKDIQVDGQTYSLSDIQSNQINLETKKAIVDEAKLTPEIFKVLLMDSRAEDALVVHIANKLGRCVLDNYKVKMRINGASVHSPLETAVVLEASDKVIVALSEENEALVGRQNENMITRGLRKLIGFFFPQKKLNDLEKAAQSKVTSQKLNITANEIRDRINHEITEHTEPFFLEQSKGVLINENKGTSLLEGRFFKQKK